MMDANRLKVLAAMARTTYKLSREDRDSLATVCDEACAADERLRRAVDAERERCACVVRDFPHWLGSNGKAAICAAIRGA